MPRVGSIDGRLLIWDFNPPASEGEALYPNRPAPGKHCTLHPINVLDGHPNGPSRAVAFNPRSAMIATAGFELVSPSPRLPLQLTSERRSDRQLRSPSVAHADSLLVQSFWLPDLKEAGIVKPAEDARVAAQ